ncbi:MAG TPA: sulfatase-like hydrolase/transferase [Verrucomicrobiales bacterium]|nr:sulfatase-like hydrolase/transferase [Verrucomicrobiales bacterium]
MPSFSIAVLRKWFFSATVALATLSRAGEPPNIVFILVDDMGYADLGAMGATDIRTPNIDRLATEGVKMTDFYANAPVCSPTRCGFITGRWQQRVGFEWALGYTAEQEKLVDGVWTHPTDMHSAIGLPASTPGIAKMLREAGYATGAFGKWHLGYADEYNPLHHGFDEYFGELLGHADYYRHVYYDGTYALRDGLEITKQEGYLTDLINQRAAAFIHRQAAEKKPFFCYVPHLAVHAPFQPPARPDPKVRKETMTNGSREDYAAMLERVDAGVGMILGELEQAGVAENTLVVLSSDNGGERWSDNRPLFHHKATLWEGGIRVPCLLRWPARLPKGKVSAQMGITMDLSATFAAVAGAAKVPGHRFDGLNLIPLLTGEVPETSDRSFFWRIQRANRKMRAVRHGQWKYLDDGGTMDLLFDLKNDISERENLNFQHPEIVSDLKKRLADWEQEMEREPKTFRVR